MRPPRHVVGPFGGRGDHDRRSRVHLGCGLGRQLAADTDPAGLDELGGLFPGPGQAPAHELSVEACPLGPAARRGGHAPAVHRPPGTHRHVIRSQARAPGGFLHCGDAVSRP